MRDAIRSLEQAAVFSSGKISYVAAESLLGMVDTEQLFLLCESLAAGDAAACFGWVASYVQSGSDIAILVNDLATQVRNLYAVMLSGNTGEEHLASALEIDAETLIRLREQSASFGTPDRLAWMLTVLGALSAELKSVANARLALEVALTRMLYPESETSLNALAARVAALEARLASGHRPERPAGPDAAGSSFDHEDPVRPTEPETLPSSYAPQSDTATLGSTNRDSTSVSGPTSSIEDTPDGQSSTSLHRAWNKVVDSIRIQRRGVAAHLGGVHPALSKDGSTLVLELPAGANTSRQYLETDAIAQMLREAVAKVFDKPLAIRLTLAEANGSAIIEPLSEALEDVPYEELGMESFEALSEASGEEPSSGLSDEPDEGPGEENDEAPSSGSSNEPVNEPSKEELENILSASLGSQIQFEEQ